MNKKRQRPSSASSDKAHRSPVEVVIAKYGLIGTVITALLGVLGLAITGYFTYLATRTQVFGAIEVTRTAEAHLIPPMATSAPTTLLQETPSQLTQAPLSTQIATESPLPVVHDVACFFYQNESQTPIEVLAETLRYSGNSQVSLVNGERIYFKDISRFEILQISAGDHVLATITLTDGTSLTQELRIGDGLFAGSTDQGKFSIHIEDVKWIVFGLKGSCQQ